MEEIRQRRVLMVPAPFQGHLPSMMNLASYLSSQGFSITIVRNEFNFKDISHNFPGIKFFTIKDGLSESDVKSLGLLEFVLELNSVSLLPPLPRSAVVCLWRTKQMGYFLHKTQDLN
ncbi:unnamed protein product [Arabidopsis thaliana]|uniref:(thale cress) hypothetical protein n=1 Tax=Arabidopsis thaliana TaxID=3702 RepID=A0A7G2EBZ1_ARATH|nr:unnamed protein product [Arabidopsis thaliana]